MYLVENTKLTFAGPYEQLMGRYETPKLFPLPKVVAAPLPVDQRFSSFREVIWNGSLEDLTCAIRLGIPLDTPDSDGSLPLFDALGTGSLEKLDLLVRSGANVNATTFDGSTPLHVAASLGAAPAVSYLIEHGAFVNSLDQEGESPLFWAIRESAGPVVELLVKCGARPDICNADDETPLEYAADLGEKEIVHFLSLHQPPTAGKRFLDSQHDFQTNYEPNYQL